MANDKDGRIAAVPVNVVRVYGHVSEWDGDQSLGFLKSPGDVWIGSAWTTCCATVVRRADGSPGQIQKLWPTWRPGGSRPSDFEGMDEAQHLRFGWQVDSEVDPVAWPAPRWFFQGREIQPEALAGDNQARVNFEAASASMRMLAPGVSPLAALAYRHRRLAKAFKYTARGVNEPVVMVPVENRKVSIGIVEWTMRFLFSGAGIVGSPLYNRFKAVIWDAFQRTPHDAYAQAGHRVDVLMTDLGRKKARLGQLFRLVKDFLGDTLGMMGLTKRHLADAEPVMGKEGVQRFARCKPWFLMDEVEMQERIPEYGESFILARRVDSCRVDSKAWIPARDLGFRPQEPEPTRQAPQLPPAAMVEVKPQESNAAAMRQ